MAPPPEYDKEPKAPDKSGANINEDIKTIANVVSEHQTNCENKSTGAASNTETQDEQEVGTLDEGRLRALLDEVMTYKCPKDREGKSSLFKELLEEVEQDEEACSAASVRGAWGRSAGRRRGRRTLPQSNSMQDLVAALGAAEGPPRRRVSPVSSRGTQGGSLPSVDTYHQESGSYVATVHCVNPSPHAPVERRVSASDAHSPAELEQLHNRRSKVAVYAPTYTARASLEIGSGSVCSGRAVTTTTASNQVRTLDSPQTRDGGGRSGPRGPTVQIDVTKYAKHAPPVKKFIPTAKSTNKQNKPEPPKEKAPVYGPPDSTVFKEINRKSNRRSSNNFTKHARSDDRDAYKEATGKFIRDISQMFDDRYGCAGASTTNDRSIVRNYVNNDAQYPISKSLPSMGRGFPKDDDYIPHHFSKDQPTFGPPEAIFLDQTGNKQKQTKSVPKKIPVKNENMNGPSDNNNNSGVNDKYSTGNRLLQTLLPDRSKSSRKLSLKNSITHVDKEKQLPDSVKEPGEFVRKKNHTNGCDGKAAKVTSNTDNKQTTPGNKSNKKTCQKVIAQTKTNLITKNMQLKKEESDPTNNEIIIKEIIPNKDIITKGEIINTTASDKIKLSCPPLESSSSLSKLNIPKENVIDQDIYKTKKHELKQNHIDISENSNSGGKNINDLDNQSVQKRSVQSTKNKDKSKSDLLNVKSDINDCDIIENSEKINTLNKLVSECDNKLRTNDSQTLSDSDVNTKQIYKQVSISSLCLSGNKICESDVEVKKIKNIKIENEISAKRNVECFANSDVVNNDNTTDINIENEKEKCEIITNYEKINMDENRDKVIIEMPDDAEEMQEIDKVAIETIENAAYEEKEEENMNKVNGETKEGEIDIDATAESAGEEKIVRNFDFSLLSGEQLIFTRLHNNAFIFLELPNHLCVTESNNQLLAINNSSDNSNVISVIPLTKYLQETNKDDNKDVHKSPKLKETKSKKRSKRSTNTLNTINESSVEAIGSNTQYDGVLQVDAGVPFSCITTPEVVTSCNTTSSTSQAIAVDPKPRSVFASSFNGLRNYGSSNCAIEDKKSLDENGNSVQGYSLTGSSQLKKNRKKKSSKNETVINIDQMDGYQGNKDVNELLRFIESDALDNARGTKLGGKSKHKDDNDDKAGKKRSSERKTTKDKETKTIYKVKRATSMEELSTRVPSLTGSEKESRRSWDDAAPPSPPPADLERDFQTVTKRKRTRRRPVPDLVQCCRRDEPTRPDVLAADEDLSGVTFGFDLDPSLLGEPVRPGLYYRAPTPLTGGEAHLQRLVAYVSDAWDDIMRCGNAKVRFYSE